MKRINKKKFQESCMDFPFIDKSKEESETTRLETEENPIVVEDSRSEESSSPSFPIVGVGASAGGLEAFTTLLQYLPQDTGMAFVLVQHLSPTHKSLLTELLGKKSSMPVTEVTNGLRVAPDHVYVIPPNTSMSISDGVLHLDTRSCNTMEQNLPIDAFLSSLAEDQKNKAIAVILSGTASDGSHGIKVIKDYGGITFAQDESAKFDMMPKNAIGTGHVDFVLSPEGIAKKLIDFSRHPYINYAETQVEELAAQEDSFSQILILLHKVSGIDFKNYKPATIKRRILRRMMLNKIENLKDYVPYLIRYPKELQLLSQDVFITVTHFFRNPDTFEALKQDVFPHLLKNRSSYVIRIWVLGCSTGEEVYSLAISFLEFWEGKSNYRFQFFATDIKESSIESARHGIYAENIINDVSPERIKRFFTKVDRGYQVNKSVREMCIFARQNVTTDPPFSKLDLISCRNLLIYLDSASQKRIIPIFHYALNPTGFLLLGQSESVVSFPELFTVVNKKAKIYSKNQVQRTPQLVLTTTKAMSAEMSGVRKPALQAGPAAGVSDIQREADRVVLKRHHHSGVVINESMEVVQFRGDTQRYLKHLPGTASLNLLKMVQEELFLELRNAIQKVMEENIPLKTKNIRIKHLEDYIDVVVEIIPFKVQPKKERFLLIVFADPAPAQAAPERLSKSEIKTGEVTGPEPSRLDSRLQDLEQELESVKMHLQGTIDAKEAANEELQAANEEILSTNEELQSLNEEFQSANEELESGKEELQATNEEITTLNDELQKRNMELNSLNDDHINLMNSMNLPIIMVGRDLRIRRFTPIAEKVFRLIPGDVGRPINDLKSSMDFPDLEALMLQAMNTDVLKEQELQDQKGRWYKIQIRPYKTGDNKIDGAVITFFDISDLKRSQEILKEYGVYREAIIQTVHHPLLILDAVLRVKMANQSFYDTFQVRPEDVQGKLIFDFANSQRYVPELRQLLKNVLPQKSVVSDYRMEDDFPHVGHKIMLFNAKKIVHEEDGRESILLAIEDITERVESQEQVRTSEVRYRRIFESAKDGILIVDPDTRKITDANPFIAELLGLARQEFIGKELWELGLLKDEKASKAAFLELQDKGIIRYEDLPLETKDKKAIQVEFVSNLYREDEHSVIQCNIRDITKRKQAEETIKHYAEELLRSNNDLKQFASIASHDLQEPLNIVSNYMEILRRKYKDKLDEAGLQFTEHIVENVSKMQELVRDLLAYSQVGRENKFKEVEMNDVCSQAIKNIAMKIKESDAKVTCDKLPRMVVDKTLTTQLFQNLISNAIKFRKPGLPPEVHISAQRQGNDWIFSLKDNGIGIAPENHSKIFEMFQRLHNKNEYPGTGIGLALCKKILEFHKGKIWVESVYGQGSVFYLKFPQESTDG